MLTSVCVCVCDGAMSLAFLENGALEIRCIIIIIIIIIIIYLFIDEVFVSICSAYYVLIRYLYG